jgi:hypothetical protein
MILLKVPRMAHSCNCVRREKVKVHSGRISPQEVVRSSGNNAGGRKEPQLKADARSEDVRKIA